MQLLEDFVALPNIRSKLSAAPAPCGTPREASCTDGFLSINGQHSSLASLGYL